MKILGFGLFLLILFCNIGMAQTWYSIDGSPIGKCYSISVLESNTSCYRAKVSIHGFYNRDVKENGYTYNQVTFDIPSTLLDVGNPALPTINQTFALPFGDGCNVSIIEGNWTHMKIGKIYPYQKNLYGNELEKESFSINIETYNSESYSPFLSRLGDLQTFKGMRNRNITICPFKYFPKDNKLSILKEFEIRVEYTHSNSAVATIDKSYNIFTNSNILKKSSIETQSSENRTNNYDYLIIVGDIPNILNSQPLTDFCKWKAFKGLKTKVVSTSTIGNTTSQIKQFISSESTSYGIKYVLFVGDYNKIPLYLYSSSAFYGYGLPINSDYWYGCLDGNNDYQADVFVGRFPVNSLNDLENMVNKTISYEKNANNYYNKALLVADYVIQHRTHLEDIASYNYITPFDFTNLDGGLASYGGHNHSNSDVINTINSGCNIVNFFGHGIQIGWGASESAGWNYYYEVFSDSCLNQINPTANFVLFNMACNTGDITSNECMLKTYLRSDHGAVSVLGATTVSLFDANKLLIQFLYDNLLNLDINHLGELITLSHIASINNMGTHAIINAAQYICGGDPSLEIWTKQSNLFENVSITNSGTILTIDSPIVTNYEIYLVSENGELFDSFDISGLSANINTPNSNCYIVLNKEGYAPYIIYVNVEDNYIQNTSFTEHSIYTNTPLTVGYDVTTSKPFGNVSVEPGSHVILKKGQGVNISNGFECKSGAIFEIND